MNPNRIEIVALPSGKVTWIIHSGGNLVHAGGEHDSALDAELEARLYATKNHPGVMFEVEHHTQLYPSG